MEWNGKESEAFRVMKQENRTIINHDDKLILRAIKTGIGNRKGLGLTEEYWKELSIKMTNGKPELNGYWNRKTGKHHGIDWLDKDCNFAEYYNRKNEWEETYRKVYNKGLPEGVELIFENNQVDLRIRNLYKDLTSRYKKTMDYLSPLAGKIIEYNPIVENPTDRNKREAMRHRVKDSFKPAEYEHNILFSGLLGKQIMKELKEWSVKTGSGHIEENTVYIQGWDKKKKTIIKYYDIGARDKKSGGTAGELYKLETTLKKDYFDKTKLRINELKEQPEIQEKIIKELAMNIVYSLECLKTGGEAMEGIQKELNLTGQQNSWTVASELLKSGRTLTERVNLIEKVLADTVKRVDRLENK